MFCYVNKVLCSGLTQDLLFFALAHTTSSMQGFLFLWKKITLAQFLHFSE